MTFRDMALRQEGLPYSPERERGWLQALLENQSPVMKLWFAIMAVNLAVCLFILKP